MNINIVRPYLPEIDAVREEFAACLSSGMVTNNACYVQQFEGKLQTFFASALKPVSFCNGEMALFHLIQAWKSKLGYGAHDSFEVLVPSFTFSGTVNAIVLNNLRPVFCDVDETLTLCPKQVSEYKGAAKMIVAVGVYGNLPDIDLLGQIARERNMALIFDNAPAFGSRVDEKFTCNLGYSEIYSFHASKIFNSMEGGAVVTSDPEIAATLIQLRDFGQFEKSRGDVAIPGLNSKMQEISALVGLKNLASIDNILALRERQILRYRDFFATCEAKGYLRNMMVKSNVRCMYLYYPIILREDATTFVSHMQDNGIVVRRYYSAVHSLSYYKGKYFEMDLDLTNSIKDKIVALPLHTIMSDAEVNYLFRTIDNYFGGHS